jgi:electron transfer flavoprotein alpha subunit
MSCLVFLEHHGDQIERGALGVLGRAAELFPGETAGVVVGSGVDEVAATAGRYGATTVYIVDDPALAAPLPQPRVDALASVLAAHPADAVLFAASVLAADVAAGLAARLGAGINWDLVDLERDGDRLVGKRSALGDTVLVDVGWLSTPRVGLVRSGTFEPRETGGQAARELVEATIRDFSLQAKIVDHTEEQAVGPLIEDADIIVAGGRGLGAPEGFKQLEELAAALGGAVAATRAVVDAGWYPYSTQVGQTGKVVAPRLYIACGISGAIQHKVGMQQSGTIVAINKDANAPIFEFCDFGVVGDLNEIVPKLTELVRQRKS